MDRTAEFKAAVNSLLSRGQLHHTSHANGAARRGKDAAAFQEFSRLATAIGHDINDTVTKLQKLTKCKYNIASMVKRKALFDDRPVEISELTHVIKQDLSRLNGQTMALQQHVRANAAKANRSTRQMDEHSANLVIILQSKLANTSMGFKEALEIRSEHQQQFSNASSDVDPYSSSSVHRRKGINGRSDDFHGQYEDDNESAGPASMLFNQQQHAPHVEQYVQNRSTAIEAVESTLQELGGIFQQLAQMVAEQRDTVQRIEANTDDIELNINEAQNQLLRYYRNISSDRMLMIKIFLTIIFVFLVISLMS
ncbi:cis-Golgi t-SNARE syntaxin [Mortierella antarctica]|nr:cis-Golgi t-SNARE syntaxin [Mortierella antarctica]